MSEYLEELEIDPYYLDDVCDTHAVFFAKWAERHVQAVEERNRIKRRFELEKTESKNELDRIRAKLDLDIRANPKDYGLEKATDKSVENRIILEDEYQEALRK